tara:strand:- start:20451 stop:21188 length:738 start_codon:yes stop_codon:yes gene_type:complete
MINRIITFVFLTQSLCLTANTVTTTPPLKNNIKAESNKTNIEKGNWVKITGKAALKIQSTENDPNKNYENITILLKYKKDSLIWISARKGLEIAQLQLTKDSIVVLNRLNKTYYSRSTEDSIGGFFLKINHDLFFRFMTILNQQEYKPNSLKTAYQKMFSREVSLTDSVFYKQEMNTLEELQIHEKEIKINISTAYEEGTLSKIDIVIENNIEEKTHFAFNVLKIEQKDKEKVYFKIPKNYEKSN